MSKAWKLEIVYKLEIIWESVLFSNLQQNMRQRSYKKKYQNYLSNVNTAVSGPSDTFQAQLGHL